MFASILANQYSTLNSFKRARMLEAGDETRFELARIAIRNTNLVSHNE
jgi:hypothetical protein